MRAGIGIGISAAILLLGAALLSPPLFRPFAPKDWRDADLASIARNFHREGMNPLLPRIDWRGDGPGYTEMELPFLPWTMALTYPLLGERPEVGSWISLALSLATLAVFLALARLRLGAVGLAVAGLWLALNPLFITATRLIRPDSLMLLAYLTAVLFFWRWLREGKRRDYALALGTTSLAVLAKLSALQIGLLFAPLVLRARGLAAIRDPRLWTFAALALAPAALWYFHAHSLWLEYGHSMGLSNQDHITGLDLIGNPAPFAGVIETELRVVLPAAAVVLVVAGAAMGAWRRWLELELWWIGAVWVYLLATAATSGEPWARHYHLLAVPPSALLVGGAVEQLLALKPERRALRAALVTATGALLLGAVLPIAGGAVRVLAQPADPLAERRLCAEGFARRVPEEDLVLVSGKNCVDADGRRVAHNRPLVLYWMDRKGFQPCREDLDVEHIDELRQRGATFAVLEEVDRRALPDLEGALAERYRRVDACGGAVLFALEASR